MKTVSTSCLTHNMYGIMFILLFPTSLLSVTKEVSSLFFRDSPYVVLVWYDVHSFISYFTLICNEGGMYQLFHILLVWYHVHSFNFYLNVICNEERKYQLFLSHHIQYLHQSCSLF